MRGLPAYCQLSVNLESVRARQTEIITRIKFLPQEKNSCHKKKIPATRINFLQKEYALCHKINFLSLEYVSCEDNKFAIIKISSNHILDF